MGAFHRKRPFEDALVVMGLLCRFERNPRVESQGMEQLASPPRGPCRWVVSAFCACVVEGFRPSGA